jgi:O-antigen ligase
LMSRIEILKNFDMQFSISPIFGNMYSDNMTSGSGTAAHSLALSLLSHTGVIGFLLFCLFFISIFLSLVKFKMQIEIHARIIRLFAFYNIIFVFMFANISNIFYSPFIWFTFGFLGFFLKLRNLNYSHKQDRDQ